MIQGFFFKNSMILVARFPFDEAVLIEDGSLGITSFRIELSFLYNLKFL